MSTNVPVIQISNGEQVVTNNVTGPKTSNNGIVMNVTSSAAPAVNGNGQLGATAMFNLAKIASSDQKQTIPNLSSSNTVAVVAAPTGSSVPAAAVTQVVMSSAPPTNQPRPQFVQQSNTTLRPAQQTMSQPILIPRGANTISLPPGIQLPPGTILMQNEKGQIVFMSRAPAPPQNQQPAGAIPIQPNPGQVIMRPAMGSNMSGIRSQAPSISSRPLMPANTPDRKEEIKKCKNFLETLIRLSSQQPRQTLDNVKKLIQGLLEGTVQPDVFTVKLQKELNSQKQPGLGAFLKKSLPELRLAISRNELSIEGLNRPNIPMPASISSSVATVQNNVIQSAVRLQPNQKMNREQITMLHKPQTQQKTQGAIGLQRMGGSTSARPSSTASPMRHTQTRSPASSSVIPRGKQRLDLKDDDDINDVATMGGVNLSEETKNILAAVPESSGQLRSCRDDVFLSHTPLAQKIRQLALQRGVRDVNNDVINLVSHACEERLRHLTEKVSLVAEHRLDIYKIDKRYDSSHDVRSQLKFLEELDKLERKKHDDSEREVLLKAAKSRSKTEDPEQAKLKMKAKEMKEQELEELRQQEANKTALAAIGPRKKRKFDDLISGAGVSGPSSSTNSTTNSSNSNQGYNRPRLKRVNLRDLIFVLEEDKESYKSDTVFKSFLR